MDELNYEKFLIYLRMFQNKIQKSFNENLKKLGISSTHVGIIMILNPLSFLLIHDLRSFWKSLFCSHEAQIPSCDEKFKWELKVRIYRLDVCNG